MRRFPSPWITIPTSLAGLGGALVGYFVTDASCAPESCTSLAATIGAVSALLAAAGVAVVIVLAVRSMAEWRQHSEREITIVDDSSDQPTPPTC